MSEKKINIEQEVMDKIHHDKIAMKPKAYFILGSIAFFLAMVSVVVISVFFSNLTLFAWRVNCPMKYQRLEMIWASFPWWAPLITIVGLIVGFWLMKKSELSYKNNFWLIIAGLLFAILTASWLIDYLNLNQLWLHRGPVRGLWQQQEFIGSRGVGGCGRHLR